MKIYHFLLDPRIGGPHVYVESIIHALKSEFDSHVLTAGRGPMTETALLNIRHLWRPLYLLEVPCNVLLLIWLVAVGRIQRRGAIFHVHGAANLAPLLAARLLGIPVLWQFHETVGGFAPFVRIGLWAVKNLPHRIVVVTRHSMRAYNLPPAEIIPSPIDLSFWTLDQTCDNHRNQNRAYRILAIGNLNPLKGHDVLLGAVKGLTGTWELTIAGARQSTHARFADQLENEADAIALHNTGGSITFAGWRDRNQLKRMLSECDTFVLPSRSEACPIALLEAMAMECVCVATDVGSVAEMIGTNQAGFVVSPGSSQELLDALAKAKTLTRASKESMGTAARAQLMNGGYTLANVAAKFSNIYSSLASRPGHT